jgi:hypothetical protein
MGPRPYPRSLIEVGRDGYRAAGGVIHAFVPFLWHERGETPVLKADDDFLGRSNSCPYHGSASPAHRSSLNLSARENTRLTYRVLTR